MLTLELARKLVLVEVRVREKRKEKKRKINASMRIFNKLLLKKWYDVFFLYSFFSKLRTTTLIRHGSS